MLNEIHFEKLKLLTNVDIKESKTTNLPSPVEKIKQSPNPLADTLYLLKKEIPKVNSTNREPISAQKSEHLESKLMNRFSFADHKYIPPDHNRTSRFRSSEFLLESTTQSHRRDHRESTHSLENTHHILTIDQLEPLPTLNDHLQLHRLSASRQNDVL